MRAKEHSCSISARPPARRAGLTAGVCLLFLLNGWTAFTAPEPTTDQSNRYLFVVDASFSMSRLKPQLLQTISALIENGVDGRLRSGDTFGLWIFTRQVDTDFPMQVWEKPQCQSIAAAAASHIKKQPFQKQGPFAPVVADMLAVIRAAKDVTILIFTDGDEPLKGTRFDKPINAAMNEVASRLRSDRKPLIIALTARVGEIVAWGVNSPERLVPLPQLPPPAQPPLVTAKRTPAPATNTIHPETAVSASITKPAAPTLSSSHPPSPQTNNPAPAPFAKPSQPRAPIIITRESIAPKLIAPPSNPPPGLAEIKPVLPSPAPSNPPPLTAVTAPVPPTPATNSAPPPPITNLVASTPPAPALAMPTNQASPTTTPPALILRSLPTEPAPPSSQNVPVETPSISLWPLAVGGSLLVAILLVGALSLRRRLRASEPSLITRGLSRSGK